MKQARTLRIIQIVFVLYVLFLFRLVHIIPATSRHTSMTPFDWLIVYLALADTACGFIIQKLILRAPANSQTALRSTPIKRWMLGHIVRMAFAISVALFGVVLHTTGGPDLAVIQLIALGLVLLLIWRPGEIPQEDQQINR
jgi:hypothetical protein